MGKTVTDLRIVPVCCEQLTALLLLCVGTKWFPVVVALFHRWGRYEKPAEDDCRTVSLTSEYDSDDLVRRSYGLFLNHPNSSWRE